jgi:hypothetical protein
VKTCHTLRITCGFFLKKTSSRHLLARPKVDLAVLVDIPGHFR